MDYARRIAENVAEVRGRIAAAAVASGRGVKAVRLVAVTKSVGVREIEAIVEADCLDLGESRPQDLWERDEAVESSNVRWHLIGHLQRNKVRRTLPAVNLIHSVDSLRLATAIDETAGELGLRTPILLEVNISGETAKHGFPPDAIEAALVPLAGCRHIKVKGLMTMASLSGGPESARRDFARLRELRDSLAANSPSGIDLAELSMGMSGDFEEAIQEGATLVRIGARLFEGVA